MMNIKPVGLKLLRQLDKKDMNAHDLFVVALLEDSDATKVDINFKEVSEFADGMIEINDSYIYEHLKIRNHHEDILIFSIKGVFTENKDINFNEVIILTCDDGKDFYLGAYVEKKHSHKYVKLPFRLIRDSKKVKDFETQIYRDDQVNINQDLESYILRLYIIAWKMLNSCDVQVSEVPPKKRLVGTAKRKKHLFEFKTLKLSRKKTIHKTSNKRISGHKKRQHKRSAHMRKLRNGKIIPVKGCTAGNPELGIIDKDYSLTK